MTSFNLINIVLFKLNKLRHIYIKQLMEEKAEVKKVLDLNEIMKKMKNRRGIEEFFQFGGMIFFYILGLYFPNFPFANSDFAFQVMKTEKKVTIVI